MAPLQAWNRLVEFGSNASYEYDGLHRRITRTEGSTTTHFYYNEQWQCVEERATEGGSATKEYVWNPHYVDTLAMTYDASGTRHFYMHDALFNVTGVVENDADVVERYVYSAYGEVTYLNADFTEESTEDSDIDNEHLFTGRRTDSGTGLQLNRNRYYHAPLGRWVNRDPIGYAAGDMNLYGYVGGMPTYWLDPLGLQVQLNPSPVTSIDIVSTSGEDTPPNPGFKPTTEGFDLGQPGLQLPTSGESATAAGLVHWVIIKGNLKGCTVKRYVTGTFMVDGRPVETPIKSPIDGDHPVRPKPDYLDPAPDGAKSSTGIPAHEIIKGNGVITVADGPGARTSDLKTIDFKFHFLIAVECPGCKPTYIRYDVVIRGIPIEGTLQNISKAKPAVAEVRPVFTWPNTVKGPKPYEPPRPPAKPADTNAGRR